MSKKPSPAEIHDARSKAAVRSTITFPSDLHDVLEKIALQKKVSLAWVVRDASERYVAEASSEAASPRQSKR